MKMNCHDDEESPFPAWGDYRAYAEATHRLRDVILYALLVGVCLLLFSLGQVPGKSPAKTHSQPQTK